MTTESSAPPLRSLGGTTVRVGWRLDGAPWLPGTGAVLNALTTGPDGLLDLVAARLGLATDTRPSPADRVLAYRLTLLDRVAAGQGAWYRDSLAVDSWGTAEDLLAMRDSLIESGWSATDPATQPPSGNDGVRLAALRDAELALAADSPVRRGRADLLVTVTQALGGTPWPLGIAAVAVDEALTELPGCWRRLLTALEPHVGSLTTGARATDDTPGGGAAGSAGAPASDRPALTVLTAETRWEMAEAVARHLHALTLNDPQAAADTVLLATEDTHELDAALAHRGLPAPGITAGTAARGSARLLTLAVDALVGSVSMPSLVSLIDWRFVPNARAAGEQPRLLPYQVSGPLLDALGTEPGVSRAPGSAWATALETIAASAPESAEAAHRLTRLIETAAGTAADTAGRSAEPAGPAPGEPTPSGAATERGGQPVDLDHVLAVLDWLADAVRPLTRGSHDATGAAAHLAAVRTALREQWGTAAPTRRDLTSLINATAETTRRPGAHSQASPWRVLGDPAHLAALHRGRHVIWWGAADPIARLNDVWDAGERTALADAGITPARPRDLAALEARAGLAGLRSATDVVAVMRRSVDGTPQAPHPLLARLAVGTTDAEPHRLAPVTTHGPTAPNAGTGSGSATWSLTEGSPSLSLAPVAALLPSGPRPQGRRVAPGTLAVAHPDRMSYSQMTMLLGSPLRWVLQYGFGLREGRLASVPTGSAMVGTFLHAIVERLVTERAGSPSPVPTPAEVGAVFDEMCPRFALELLSPGRGAERRVVREQACESVHDLFALLERLGATGLAGETEIDFPVDLAPRTAAEERAAGEESATGDEAATMRGRVDLSGRVGDAALVVDLKWTRSDRHFSEAVNEGTDLQLAVYAAAEAHAARDAHGEAAVGYYMLKQNRLITDSEVLNPDGRGTGPQRERLTALWADATATARGILAELDAGSIPVGTAGLRLDLDGDLGWPPSADYDAAIESLRTEALAHHRVLTEDRFPDTPYRVLEGLAGD